MQAEHRNTAILLAFLSIPFGIAVYQDATGKVSHASSRYDDFAYAMEMQRELGDGYEYDEFDDYYDYRDDSEARAALAAYDEPVVMSSEFFRDVVFDGGAATVPTLAGPLAKVKIGMSEEAYEDLASYRGDWTYEGIPGHENATADAYIVGGELVTFHLSFPDDGSALHVLVGQWGGGEDPHETGDYSWYDPARKLRATYRHGYGDGTLVFSRYQTLEEFVAADSRLFSFEDEDVTALSEKRVEELIENSAYGDYGEATAHVVGIRGARYLYHAADYQFEDGRVTQVSVSMELNADDQMLMQALLKTKLGNPAKSGGGEFDYHTTYTFKQGSRVIEWNLDDLGGCSLVIRPK